MGSSPGNQRDFVDSMEIPEGKGAAGCQHVVGRPGGGALKRPTWQAYEQWRHQRYVRARIVVLQPAGNGFVLKAVAWSKPLYRLKNHGILRKYLKCYIFFDSEKISTIGCTIWIKTTHGS